MADTDNLITSTPGVVDKPAVSFSAELPPRLLPTFSEACRWVDSRYSCLVVNTHRRHLPLSPRYLNKKRSAIQEQLNEELLRYSPRLEGVPVAYDNIKIVGELAEIHDDDGYIHLNIQVDFVIFQPQCGEKLVGVVNNVAPSHIGCVVHGCFNASIPKPFKMPIEAWQHVGVKVGDHVEFEVFRLDSDAVGVFCIRGKMDKTMETDILERFNEATKEQTGEVSSDEGAAEGGANTEPNVIPEDTPKKKSKKRAFQETLLHNVPGTQEGSAESNTTLEEIPKKKSKKRKYQELNSQTHTAEVDAPMEHISAEKSLLLSVDSIFKNERKKKKRHDILPSVDINNIKVEECGLLGHDIETLVPSSEEQPRKSKKKQRIDNPDQGLTQDLKNGVMEGLTFTESRLSEDSRAEDVTILKKKHKKKHKLSSVIEDSTLESTNGGTDIASQESLLDDLTTQQETPKRKKHKRKHHDNV
ncbi:DNA-directed RNA polymerase I subunit RPA43 [Rana temporaria]|uniref:DNA-directed RNA polymerase I subunit RPA43 n=1 Tax=Rana temporaria TaxID=8407 RepID=UPI001AADE4BA|nr:DNA-directed RNA polymerase I subunit RPA43 [Rana temporaria]